MIRGLKRPYVGQKAQTCHATEPCAPYDGNQWGSQHQTLDTISASSICSGACARAACGGSLMATWQIRLRQLCFVAAEFAVATAFIITFVAAVKYGL
jgi:hypothetical protein